MFPTYPDDIETPRVSKTHRGRRARPKAASVATPTTHDTASGVDHMGTANTHLKAAHADPTKAGTLKHLFRALSSLKKAT